MPCRRITSGSGCAGSTPPVMRSSTGKPGTRSERLGVGAGKAAVARCRMMARRLMAAPATAVPAASAMVVLFMVYLSPRGRGLVAGEGRFEDRLRRGGLGHRPLPGREGHPGEGEQDPGGHALVDHRDGPHGDRVRVGDAGPAGGRMQRGRKGPRLHGDDVDVLAIARDPHDLVHRAPQVGDVLEHAGDVEDRRVAPRRDAARERVGVDHGRLATAEDVGIAGPVLVEAHRAVEPALLARQHDEQGAALLAGALVGRLEQAAALLPAGPGGRRLGDRDAAQAQAGDGAGVGHGASSLRRAGHSASSEAPASTPAAIALWVVVTRAMATTCLSAIPAHCAPGYSDAVRVQGWTVTM
jgi:hypothetical protein